MSLALIGLSLLALPSALAATYDVSVGNGTLRFDPEYINAVEGDIINFTFHPKNHTVTQSSFAEPCVPLAGGFTSGFVPVAVGSTSLPTYQVQVNDASKPIWVYCAQPGPPSHCGQGMVFAINAPADPSPHSFSAFQALAISTNGTTATTTSSTSSSYITPPAPSVVTVTATVTEGTSVWTTTYGSYIGSSPPTPAAQPVNHKITVGDGGLLAYNPTNITASIGDTVTFEFHPKNHTVTQSNFLKPCQPLADTSTTGQVGFASGFEPVSANATTFPTFEIQINDTAPIWGYCGQVGHCGEGMVFSINAVADGPNNFTAFQTLAKEINGSSTSSSTSTSAAAAGTTSAKSAAIRMLNGSGYLNMVALLVSVGLGVTYL